jgi:Rod binding domain-containing protein
MGPRVLGFPSGPSFTSSMSLWGELTELQARVSRGDSAVMQQVARELEALFWSMIIQRLRATLSEEGLFPNDRSDAMGALFDLYLGRALAASESLGIARAVRAYGEGAGKWGDGSDSSEGKDRTGELK